MVLSVDIRALLSMYHIDVHIPRVQVQWTRIFVDMSGVHVVINGKCAFYRQTDKGS